MIQQIIKWLGIRGRSEKFKLTSSPKKSYDSTTELICVKRELGLGSAVVMTLGSIVGAGLFISPKGVLMCTGSVGMSLVVWSVAGIISMIGALVFVFVGASGDPDASCCDHTVVDIRQLHAGDDFLSMRYPQGAVRLIAALPICILTFINCRNVQWVTRLQGVFTAAKAFAIILIIVGGVYHLCKGNVQNFENAFQDTTTKPGIIALSFYYALYAYGGW
ncbi:y+L amino acid transporter 2 [Caerostris extrusa]|uniref:Y+L amino acid transporter 2 n=1 Tax=Caerostris extrusa TaxID=172846 RepID=A0AAV4XY77_CAEEX|nr:y+L amino acid transporter 2 [Caerostris extrusa]